MANKTVEELKNQKVGSGELSKSKNIGGVYVRKAIEDGVEITIDRVVAKNDPRSSSSVQADAAVRMGYVWEREAVPSDFHKELVDENTGAPVSTQTENRTSVDTVPRSEFDALAARLEALEGSKTPVEPEGYPDKPMLLWNKAQLTAKAVEMKLEIPEGSTNKEIVELIESSQE